MFYLINMLIYVGLIIVDTVSGLLAINVLYAIVVIIPELAISVRRLHDIGKSGWWMLLLLVPFIGPIVLLVWFCQKSVGDNQYGQTDIVITV